MNPEHLLACQSCLGEGPLWHAAEAALYWVDIQGSQVHRLRPATLEHAAWDADISISALGLRAGGGFVVATKAGLGTWQPGQPHLNLAHQPERHLEYNRFNDGAVDPGGRFFAGTMYHGPDGERETGGKLYRLDPDGSLHVAFDDVGVSNGLGWSPDLKTMYYTDSPRRVIYAFDYDVATGEIENCRHFVDVPDGGGFPDGLAVDGEGCVWSACWDGWRIARYDPEGKLEREVQMPVQRPTSCAFGGPNLDTLYITSAWVGLSERARAEQPLAGDLFVLQPGVKGRLPWVFGA
jgi:L-arabinonolactonase